MKEYIKADLYRLSKEKRNIYPLITITLLCLIFVLFGKSDIKDGLFNTIGNIVHLFPYFL